MTKVAEAAATETVKTTAKKVLTPSRLAQAKTAIKKAAPLAGLAGIAAAVGMARVHWQGKLAEATLRRSTSPEARALRALEAVETNLRRKLTPDERRTLWKQHVEFFRKNPNAR